MRRLDNHGMRDSGATWLLEGESEGCIYASSLSVMVGKASKRKQKREFVFRARVHPRPPQGPMDLEYSDDDDQLAKTRVVTYDPSPGLISSPVPV